jgi:hypothetical protein
MGETNLGELKKLAEEAKEHNDKTVELFDKAQKLEIEAKEATETNQQQKLIDKVREINRKAIAEAHKVIEIQNALLLKERDEIEARFETLQSMEISPSANLKDEE